jgi:predicted transcriptional regulator
MARTPSDVTEKELEILQLLWERQRATIRQLTEALYPGGGTAQYATVQKLLGRLEGKGFVEREREAAAHMFRAVISREKLMGQRLESMAEKLCGGSLTPLLTHLVRTRKWTSRERQELRQLIDELDRSKGKREGS